MNDAGGKARILLAEDGAVGQLVTTQILEKAGYDVSVVSDGAAALDRLRNAPFDLVVMDCMMPGMDGFEATRAIRDGQAGDAARKIPIVALTALNSAEDRERVDAAGMDEFVGKPVGSVALLGVVSRCLEESGGNDADGGDTDPPEDKGRDDSLADALEEWSPGFMDSIIDQFLDEVPQEVSELREALASEDLQRLRDIAHRLRGSADILKARILSARARALEKAADVGSKLLVAQLTPALISELEKLTVDLRDES